MVTHGYVLCSQGAAGQTTLIPAPSPERTHVAETVLLGKKVLAPATTPDEKCL